MVRRCFARVVGEGGEVRLDLLMSGQLQLSFAAKAQVFDTLEEALVWELDLLAREGGVWEG